MTRLQLDYSMGVFLARCSFEERELPRQAGFRWNPTENVWYTESFVVAARLREHATPRAEEKFKADRINVTPWARRLPDQAHSLMSHQIEALYFALGRDKSYLAMDPGLGKTAVAAVMTTALYDDTAGMFAGVYVTPPFLYRNVVAEFKRWAPHMRLKALTSKTVAGELNDAHVLVLPDTFLQAVWLNYVVQEFLAGAEARLLIVDEAHRFKNDSAKRTQHLLGHGNRTGLHGAFNRKTLMSGTPTPNGRPIELFPVLNALAPETMGWRTKEEFGIHYCAGELTDMGWNFSGVSNAAELKRQLVAPTGPFMLRQKKALLNLPPKTEELFILSDDITGMVAQYEHSVVAKYKSSEDAIQVMLAQQHAEDEGSDFLPLSTYRRMLGELKAKAVLPYLNYLLEESNESILVYGYHKSTLAILSKGLAAYQPFVIDGSTPNDDRDSQVREFQSNPSRRLFIGNYLAMGVGFTLTKATRIVFVEFSWVPAENDQASDRPHRIGQTLPVLVQYVVFQGSIDEAMVRSNLAKRDKINQVV